MFLEYLRIVLERTLERVISRVTVEVLIYTFRLVLSTFEDLFEIHSQSILVCLFSLSSLILLSRVFGFVYQCSSN